MMRGLAALGLAVGTLLVAETAGAQATGTANGFGQKGQLIFSADRLFPLFAYTNNTVIDNTTNPSASYSRSGTSFGLLWGNSGFSASAGGPGDIARIDFGNPSFYSVPRVGFDYAIIDNLTIGGNVVVFFPMGGSETNAAGATSTTTGTGGGSLFGLVPRVGYVLGMNDVLSFWLRGGLSFYTATANHPSGGCNSTSDSSSVNLFGLVLDPQVVISPVPHFAFMAGPALDWGFAGGASSTTWSDCNRSTTTSYGANAFDFSLNASLMGWL